MFGVPVDIRWLLFEASGRRALCSSLSFQPFQNRLPPEVIALYITKTWTGMFNFLRNSNTRKHPFLAQRNLLGGNKQSMAVLATFSFGWGKVPYPHKYC